MAKVIVLVLLLLGAIVYGALFFSWNATPQEITGFVWGGMRYSQTLPLASLVFIGLVLGALVMGVACWSAWAAQKARAEQYAATIRKAKTKLQEQLNEIRQLRAEVERLQAQLESLQAGNGTWGEASQADIEAHLPELTPAAEAPEAGNEAEATPSKDVDDDDVI